MKIQGVVFDFDGVIIDTEKARFEAMQKVFSTFGQTLSLDYWLTNIGRASYVLHPFDLLAKLTGSELDRDKLHSLHVKIELEMADAYPVLPGVVNRIQEIKEIGGRIAVASSSSRVWVEGHLRKRNLLQYFDATVCREDTLLHKPDPEPYLTALRRINSPPSYSFAIEDSPLGIEAAIGAGLKCIAVGCSLTKHMDLSKATHIVESLDQVSFTKMLNEN